MANVNWMKISRISEFLILSYINIYLWYTKSILIRTPSLFWGSFLSYNRLITLNSIITSAINNKLVVIGAAKLRLLIGIDYIC